MARVELVPEALDDLDRFFEHIARTNLVAATAQIEEILQMLRILDRNPLIGRPVSGGKRALVMGHGSRGYVALYAYAPDAQAVFVLALRSQREAGYKHG